jgi:hypothetical protein
MKKVYKNNFQDISFSLTCEAKCERSFPSLAFVTLAYCIVSHVVLRHFDVIRKTPLRGQTSVITDQQHWGNGDKMAVLFLLSNVCEIYVRKIHLSLI